MQTKIFDTKFSSFYSSLSDKRNQVDYDFEEAFSKEEAQKIIDQTTEFLNETKKYLTSK